MLFGSIENLFGAAQGSVEAFGGSLGTLLGTGTGSVAGLFSNLLEAVYAASGQPIPA